MAAVAICSDFGAPKNKVWHCFHCFPICLPWSAGTGCHDLSFWMLSFKPTFSLSSFTFIKRLCSSSLSAIRVVSSAYLRLLIFLLAILIPDCASSSPAFLMMYFAYKLNKQGHNIQPWRTPFPIWNQSVVPCAVPTVASWPACEEDTAKPVSGKIYRMYLDVYIMLPLTVTCKTGSNSWNCTWNNRLVPNRKRSSSRLYIVTLLV